MSGLLSAAREGQSIGALFNLKIECVSSEHLKHVRKTSDEKKV
jgi:hypothetical protein